jgi:uroporphyrinogen-III synthase
MNLSGVSPLNGKRVVITRASHQAAPLVKELERHEATVISIPTIEIQPPQSFQPLDKALAKIQKYDWLLLTSVNGVEALQRRLAKAGMPASALRHLSIAAIGPGTRAAAEALGLKVAVMPAKYVAEAVVDELKGDIRGKQVLLVRAKVARDVIPRELSQAGAEVEVVDAYQTVVPRHSSERLLEYLHEGRLQADFITFTSSSTVRNFSAILPSGSSPKGILDGVTIVSIGPITSETLTEIGLQPTVEAIEYSIHGLVTAMTQFSGGTSHP